MENCAIYLKYLSLKSKYYFHSFPIYHTLLKSPYLLFEIFQWKVVTLNKLCSEALLMGNLSIFAHFLDFFLIFMELCQKSNQNCKISSNLENKSKNFLKRTYIKDNFPCFLLVSKFVENLKIKFDFVKSVQFSGTTQITEISRYPSRLILFLGISVIYSNF